jgi:mRNA interferase MazF
LGKRTDIPKTKHLLKPLPWNGTTQSVTVCPFTATDVDAPLLRYSVPANESNGLEIDSHLMIDKLTTVRRTNVIRHAGQLTAGQLVDVERLVMVFLGLAN